MGKIFSMIVMILAFTSCAVSKDPLRKTARLLQKGKLQEDTSWVYQLPYEPGTAHRLIQGYFSRFSHRNRAALDFKMRKGTRITAARDGVVVRMQEQNDKGGWNRKFRRFANFVVIEHNDGTRAGYWHLQKDGVLVNLGDSVKAGQVIALSGNTGYSATAHLHFIVWKSANGTWTQIASRFMTRKGPKYLKPMRRYKHPD